MRRAFLVLLLTIYATTPAVAAACAAACAVPAIGAGPSHCHDAGATQPQDAAPEHSHAGDDSDGSSPSDALMQAACAFAATAALVSSPVEPGVTRAAERVPAAVLSHLSLSTPPPGEPPRG